MYALPPPLVGLSQGLSYTRQALYHCVLSLALFILREGFTKYSRLALKSLVSRWVLNLQSSHLNGWARACTPRVLKYLRGTHTEGRTDSHAALQQERLSFFRPFKG